MVVTRSCSICRRRHTVEEKEARRVKVGVKLGSIGESKVVARGEPGQGQAQPLLYCAGDRIVGAGLVPALAHPARPRPEVTDLPASPSPTPFPFLDARLAMNGRWINPIPTKHADGWIRMFWYSEL